MRFDVRHLTVYRYDAPVRLGEHRVRLSPRGDGRQHVVRHRLRVTPRPLAMDALLDAEGNVVHHLRFDGSTQVLEIVSNAVVDALAPIELAGRASPLHASLPASYPDVEASLLAYHRREELGCAQVDELGRRLAERGGGRIDGFLEMLTTHLHTSIQREIRERGDPQSPADTLARGVGACRDLAVLFNAVCRSQGIAARFVSGYQSGDPDQQHRHLHAWPEVYLPGGGWRGYDPTHGLAVADQHVAVAASWLPTGAAPVSGSIRGDGAVATLDFEIQLTTGP